MGITKIVTGITKIAMGITTVVTGIDNSYVAAAINDVIMPVATIIF
jgi:hypothetical protein